MAIVIERTITVKNNQSLLDNPLYLYVGDGDITCLFTINEIKKAAKFGSINPNNLITEGVGYGEIRIYKPDGALVFTNRAEVIDDRLQAVISFENMNDYTEAGIHRLQIHLYDESNGDRNRFTIPPVELNVLLPIGVETATVDMASVGFALLDSRGEEEPTFIDGSYNKTEWTTGDIITSNKMNKIEDAIYEINNKSNSEDYATEEYVNNALESKADSVHSHDEYAEEGHSHNGVYAEDNHTHTTVDDMNGLKLWYGTQSEYNAISNKDSMTLYFIKEE